MPELLLGRIINACSNPGDTVLDPFGGSGTTLVAAKKLARRFIGFELSENYAAQIESRLADASPRDPPPPPDNPTTPPPTPHHPHQPHPHGHPRPPTHPH